MNKNYHTPTSAECGCFYGSTANPQDECNCGKTSTTEGYYAEIKKPKSKAKYDPFNASAMWKKPRHQKRPSKYVRRNR